MTDNLPVFLQNRQSRSVAQGMIGNLGLASPPYLSIKGNRFTLVDAVGDQEPVTTVDPKTGIPYIDVCIADAGDHASKIYFDKPFDATTDNFSPPPCWSDNGIAPSINASNPQAHSCTPDPTGVNGCKLAIWGAATSRVTGKGVPACGKYQKLALVLPGDDVTFLLRVPPNSLKNLQEYTRKFVGQKLDISDVLTRISFEGDGKLGTLTFQAIDYIDEATFTQREAVLAAKKTDMLVGRGDQPIVGAVLPNPATAQIAAPTAASQAGIPSTAPLALPSGNPTPQGTPTQPAPASASSASPSEPAQPPEPARRRRRNTAPDASAAGPQTAPFPAGQAATPAQPFQPAPAPSFGIQSGVAPDPALNAALKSVFG